MTYGFGLVKDEIRRFANQVRIDPNRCPDNSSRRLSIRTYRSCDLESLVRFFAGRPAEPVVDWNMEEAKQADKEEVKQDGFADVTGKLKTTGRGKKYNANEN